MYEYAVQIDEFGEGNWQAPWPPYPGHPAIFPAITQAEAALEFILAVNYSNLPAQGRVVRREIPDAWATFS